MFFVFYLYVFYNPCQTVYIIVGKNPITPLGTSFILLICILQLTWVRLLAVASYIGRVVLTLLSRLRQENTFAKMSIYSFNNSKKDNTKTTYGL